MPTWPLSLPQAPLLAGFQFSPQGNVASFGTEVGPGKARRRSTARVRQLPFNTHMSDAQLDDFIAFFEDDLADGALPFDLTDPVSGGTRSFRFSSPQESPYTSSKIGPDLWLVATQLMMLP